MRRIFLVTLLLFLCELNVNAGLFASAEEDAFNFVKNKEYAKALKIIQNKNDFDANKYRIIYYSDDISLAKALIKKGAKLNEKIKYSDLIIKVLKLKGDKQYYDDTPLFKIRNAEVLKLLIDKGAKVNARGKHNETPMMNARTFSALRVFLENGAEINAQTGYGTTALKNIVNNDSRDEKKHLETLKMVYALLMLKADPNLQDNGGHVALHSIRWGHADIGELLVAKGADITITTPEGNSALCYAIADRKMELIKFYFRVGANFDFRCEKGMSLVEYSVKKNYKSSQITKFLIELQEAMEQQVQSK
jgi:ankyrin repeat protein